MSAIKQIYDWEIGQIPIDGKRILALFGYTGNKKFCESAPLKSYDKDADVFVTQSGGQYSVSQDTDAEKRQKTSLIDFFGKKK